MTFPSSVNGILLREASYLLEKNQSLTPILFVTKPLDPLQPENHSYNIANSPGGRLNKKDGLTRCGDSHVKDKTS